KERVAVVQSPAWSRFAHSFGHIFVGGYSAGYYSYLWAEVLSADAFGRFEEEGIFNPETGASFLNNILEQGGSEDPMVLFERFRGRAPSTAALLRQRAIA
ncbi:MAG: M3 family metallopeptidase, partial [Vibrionaceae bacterium]